MNRPLLLSLFLAAGFSPAFAQISLTSNSSPYTQNFNSILSTVPADGTTQSTPVLPAGWVFSESGSNANTTYRVDDGGETSGDTYLYGAAASTERALGGVRSGTLVPTFGALFTNNTGAVVHALQISYTGEMWRLGTADVNDDRLDFQYSLNATSLTTGTWIDFNALDFTSLTRTTAGAKNGNTLNSSIGSTVSGLNISIGATFAIRWVDVDISGSEDGLAVDDFSITAIPEPSSFAGIAGMLSLACVAFKRRRRSHSISFL